MKRSGMTIYLALTLAICLVPLAGLLWYEGAESSENRRLSEFPALKSEDGWNIEFLSEAGDWFEEHFAYRQELVTADARLRGSLFGVSTEDGVIKGTDGWLYYMDSLEDYLGSEILSDRGIFNIAHTLHMMQEYIENAGRTFLFTVAPNKNSLYPEHMPYYDRIKVSDTHSIDRLRPVLEEQGVNYVDLYSVFEAKDEVLYHARDSHWNNKGAALAAEALLDGLGREHRSYEDADYTVRADFEGDLDVMLYPEDVTPEDEIYYDEPFTYEYLTEIESTFDPEIDTSQPDAQGGLLMYRDSFGNALLPFMAQEFANAKFSRGVPYYVDDMFFCDADTVVVERAERFLPDMSKNPPVFQSPEREIAILQAKDRAEEPGETTCEASDEGLFLKLGGRIDESYIDTDSTIYLCVDGEDTYEAFPVNIETEDVVTDCGYAAYIEKGRLEGEEITVELYVDTDGELLRVYRTELDVSR